MRKTNEVEQLIYLFSKLPGLGQRSSRRIVLHLLQEKEVRLKNLMDGLALAASKIQICEICRNIDSHNICHICTTSDRNKSIIAIVETVAELWAIERSGNFNGKYHVLGGALSASMKKSPDSLRLPQLLERCMNHGVTELIIATNATLEGQTTAYFITEYFRNYNLKISRLANGIPIGGELDYLDEGTLSLAIALRQPFD
ncbi:Recombination protein RecR [Candidatus Trichorickettsia mobilis]|uniref:Recombination protein RecR n=1 Tax=Candidatus Trichorickettsia mobilis TaxID=1346319 RepID=A0ABZ0UVD0_9RICK|nr:recombination mediator RecR [Candidatus Trichorickettsia mobilis]WPY00577.1 Recombination protein RecR [Candidatus Trichorickettsia mobilis]